MTADTRHPNGLRGLLALCALSAATVIAGLWWLATAFGPAGALVGIAVLVLLVGAVLLAAGGDES